MPKTPDIAGPARTPEERELESLERDVVRGQRALRRRNEKLLELLDAGFSQAELARRINRARVALGAEPLTRDAVFALTRRVGYKVKKEEN